jgi:hypothetical protein
VFTFRRLVALTVGYPAAAAAIAFTLAAGMPGTAGPPSPSPSTTTGAGVVWAVNASGQKVPVSQPVFAPTPVHPEKITHPGTDDMGAINEAHAPWGRSALVSPALALSTTVAQLPGIDISAYQGNINWASVAPYIDFSYAKATEGTYYTNPDFYNQYEGPYLMG